MNKIIPLDDKDQVYIRDTKNDSTQIYQADDENSKGFKNKKTILKVSNIEDLKLYVKDGDFKGCDIVKKNNESKGYFSKKMAIKNSSYFATQSKKNGHLFQKVKNNPQGQEMLETKISTEKKVANTDHGRNSDYDTQPPINKYQEKF